MNCSVCNRNNAVTLSICPSCGAMLNDSVRQELVGKISAAKTIDSEMRVTRMTLNITNQPSEISPSPTPLGESKTATTEIAAKPTSPTLVEFHSKNATVPEWRLQLQNVVRQRQERGTREIVTETAAPVQLITSGANALKAEIAPQPQILPHKNPTLNSALERIEKSRRQFLEQEKPDAAATVTAAPVKANKNFPFYIAGKTSDADFKPAEKNPPVNTFAKPKLASFFQPKKEKLDTNKLPPIPKPAAIATSFESRPATNEEIKKSPAEVVEPKTATVEMIEKPEAVEIVETVEIEEFDDCAPFALRFNAGLFDLIIGSFTSLFLLSPFMLWGGSWFSAAGLFTFLATCAVVMFIYMTTAIGFYGRTFGMRLFSLDIVDIESEDFPTFHQAAVSSAVYLMSLALGGIGFLSILFNEDKRAVHDLVSGTIIVKE